MRRTSNYSLLLPDEIDSYKVSDMNTNSGIIDTQMKSNQNAVSVVSSSLATHAANKTNPHEVTKSQIGLGNVPNVSTNDQTPTYSDTSTLSTLVSGEKLNVSMQKIKYAITSLINHIGNKNNPHAVTKAQVGLGNVDNTSDANKPVSTATQNALDGKLSINGGEVSGSLVMKYYAQGLTLPLVTGQALITTYSSGNGMSIAYRKNGSVGYTKEVMSVIPSNDGNSASVNLHGNSDSTTKLSTSRTISLTGDVTGSVSFDGSQNVSINTTVPSKITLQTYEITMNSYYIFVSGKLARQGNVVSLSLNFYPYYTLNGGSSYTIGSFDSFLSTSDIVRTCGSVDDRESLPVIIDANKITIRPITNIVERTRCGFSVSWIV